MIPEFFSKAFSSRQNNLSQDHQQAFRLFNGFTEGYTNVCIDVYGKTILLHDYADSPDQELLKNLEIHLLEIFPWVECIIIKMRNSQSAFDKRGRIVFGKKPDEKIFENGVWYAIDLQMNRDASFYLDTRNLRRWAKENLAKKDVLNTFAYTGSLGVAAMTGGARKVIQTDRNINFLNLARQSTQLNQITVSDKDFLAQDFFTTVGQLKQSGQLFDCVFLDPPFFSTSAKGTVDLETGNTRLINKVRPLIRDNGWLVSINNALYVGGESYLHSLEALCVGGYLNIEEMISVPEDFTGYGNNQADSLQVDPKPFNHSTKIVVLRVRKKKN